LFLISCNVDSDSILSCRILYVEYPAAFNAANMSPLYTIGIYSHPFIIKDNIYMHVCIVYIVNKIIHAIFVYIASRHTRLYGV